MSLQVRLHLVGLKCLAVDVNCKYSFNPGILILHAGGYATLGTVHLFSFNLSKLVFFLY